VMTTRFTGALPTGAEPCAIVPLDQRAGDPKSGATQPGPGANAALARAYDHRGPPDVATLQHLGNLRGGPLAGRPKRPP
jgi:hypothetical protein